MTAPRQGGGRRKELDRAERICSKLQVDAMLHKRASERESNPADARGWWVVDRALAEAITALREMRGAPKAASHAATYPVALVTKRPELDHMGVPPPTENK